MFKLGYTIVESNEFLPCKQGAAATDSGTNDSWEVQELKAISCNEGGDFCVAERGWDVGTGEGQANETLSSCLTCNVVLDGRGGDVVGEMFKVFKI